MWRQDGSLQLARAPQAAQCASSDGAVCHACDALADLFRGARMRDDVRARACSPVIEHTFISLYNISNILWYLYGITHLMPETTSQNRKMWLRMATHGR